MATNEAEVTVIAQEIIKESLKDCQEREKTYLDEKFNNVMNSISFVAKQVDEGFVRTEKDAGEIKTDISLIKIDVGLLKEWKADTERRLQLGCDKFTELEKSAKSAHKRISSGSKTLGVIITGLGFAYLIIQIYQFVHGA